MVTPRKLLGSTAADAASAAVCWQHEPQHPPVNARMPAAVGALTTRIPINIPSCFRRTPPTLTPHKKSSILHIGKSSRISEAVKNFSHY